MDLLQDVLKRKRQEVAQDFGARKYVKRGEIEKKHLQRIREEEKKELQIKSRVSPLPPVAGIATSDSDNRPSSAASESASLASSKVSEEEKKIDELILSRAECARYLVPLFDKCKRRVLPADIRQALMIVVTRCLERDYLAAMDQYIKLAIGL
ncbi:hypothetical protein GOP47_0027553 [Adiantum capillus-veneris]|nr:hypothetical protein GOP47_0027553 [Adiantum capillus-veneris]